MDGWFGYLGFTSHYSCTYLRRERKNCLRDGWRSNGGEGDGARYSMNSKHADWEIKIQSKAKMCRNVQRLKDFFFYFYKSKEITDILCYKSTFMSSHVRLK